jgi:hypothetical protein
MSDEGPHVSNEQSGAGSVFSELLRLQTEFQARLAEETLTYLRRVQGAAAPATPGTVLVPQDGASLAAAGAPGSTVELRLEVENRQRVHCVVTPMLGPLVSADGVTWMPAGEPAQPSTLVPPDQVRTLQLLVPLPAELPAGTYRGALLLQGFGDGGVAVAIEATPPAAAATPRRSTARKAQGKRPRAKRAAGKRTPRKR